MRASIIPIHIMSAAIFIQLFLGGAFLVQNAGYPSISDAGDIHPAFGLVVGIVSIVALVFAWVAKPRNRPLGIASTLAFVFVFLAGVTSEKSTMLAHDTVALIAFGFSISASFISTRHLETMGSQPSTPGSASPSA